MIASLPVRLLSLALVALVGFVGVRAVVGGLAFEGDPLNTWASGGDSSDLGRRTVGVVDFVVDGDTIQVTIRDGRELQVRLLGISAPEIPHPDKAGECYGQESKQELTELLPAGARVSLVGDPTQHDVDSYDRLLRYVKVSSRDVGAAMIRAGAAAARDSPDPVSRRATYVELEDQARGQGAGMWSACS